LAIVSFEGKIVSAKQFKNSHIKSDLMASKRPGRVLTSVIVGAMAVLTLGAMAGNASAATDIGSTTANVQVSSSIVLSGGTAALTLTGAIRATVTQNAAVTMNVETNNLAGYTVTVQSSTATLAPPVHTIVNPDSIPIAALTVRETGGSAFTALSNSAPVTVHTQTVRSANGGDTVSNDFRVVIPFVNQDVYSTTLNYVATTS
jgi:hypothetical protein